MHGDLIWRLETYTGVGGYMRQNDAGISDEEAELLDAAYGWNNARHPMPWSDGIEHHSHGHRFGFASLEQARAWFNDAAANAVLAKLEVGLAAYLREEAGNVIEGGHQIEFIPGRHRACLPLAELLTATDEDLRAQAFLHMEPLHKPSEFPSDAEGVAFLMGETQRAYA